MNDPALNSLARLIERNAVVFAKRIDAVPILANVGVFKRYVIRT
ncbi:Uncharacterised protein [Afipia felis]|uniref:Uncharacterized protein n=2 Tax=Afipia felis TaxID=1035 RepID=A0A380W2A0_AFIFE|nr:hypothetical protein HMPREF9697_02788 [Afipia felis ATCC 53690]SUU75005.1 Uncharacterised protein [Afipia felis]SUU83071.1 Uncharacterised protein [Afipia felis]